ncbi:6-carboxytetrahydropterin synthase QueD [Thermodesulfobacteriota bacterium]
MYELKVRTRFSAAHRLTMVGQKCENLHGHNWNIEVCVAGRTLDKGGVLLDFGIIKQHLAEVIAEVDHQFLNDLEAFSQNPPSSENIARHIARRLSSAIDTPSARVARVTAWESEDSCATYVVQEPP